MTPTSLGLAILSDTWAELYCLSSVDGTPPLTCTLQRAMGAGAFSDVATILPAVPYYDHGLAAGGASYSWRVRVTDAASQTAYSNTVAGTTVAARSVTPYALGTPTHTSIVNGTQPTDTTGAAQYFPHAMAFWDEAYGQYFLIAGLFNPSTQIHDHTVGFVSSDLMNWTPAAGNPLSGLTINGVTYKRAGGQPSFLPGPRDGKYYLFSTVVRTQDTYSGFAILQASAPLGPYSYFSGPFLFNSCGDERAYLDYDGTVWWIYSPGGGGGFLTAQQITADFTGLGPSYAFPTLTYGAEAPGPFRKDRNFFVHASSTSGWNWNPNFCQYCAGPSSAASAQVWPNASMYATPAQLLAAPAGASGGYGGTNGGAYQGYTGGTGTGIDPKASYASQSCAVLRTRTGQHLAMLNRWSSTGDNTSTYVWLPMTYNGSGMPLLAFAATPVPQAQPARPGLGPYYLQAPTPGISPALIGAPR